MSNEYVEYIDYNYVEYIYSRSGTRKGDNIN